jgi:hypothetical protein
LSRTLACAPVLSLLAAVIIVANRGTMLSAALSDAPSAAPASDGIGEPADANADATIPTMETDSGWGWISGLFSPPAAPDDAPSNPLDIPAQTETASEPETRASLDVPASAEPAIAATSMTDTAQNDVPLAEIVARGAASPAAIAQDTGFLTGLLRQMGIGGDTGAPSGAMGPQAGNPPAPPSMTDVLPRILGAQSPQAAADDASSRAVAGPSSEQFPIFVLGLNGVIQQLLFTPIIAGTAVTAPAVDVAPPVPIGAPDAVNCRTKAPTTGTCRTSTDGFFRCSDAVNTASADLTACLEAERKTCEQDKCFVFRAKSYSITHSLNPLPICYAQGSVDWECNAPEIINGGSCKFTASGQCAGEGGDVFCSVAKSRAGSNAMDCILKQQADCHAVNGSFLDGAQNYEKVPGYYGFYCKYRAALDWSCVNMCRAMNAPPVMPRPVDAPTQPIIVGNPGTQPIVPVPRPPRPAPVPVNPRPPRNPQGACATQVNLSCAQRTCPDFVDPDSTIRYPQVCQAVGGSCQCVRGNLPIVIR